MIWTPKGAFGGGSDGVIVTLIVCAAAGTSVVTREL
jgi:hypothetical protein